eukprot:PLAT6820.1.p1 GENE.PLAT6820.1~~PLAT6820.1.p1  ORF type:complete len:405 (-),score=82.50 PLAT6820.1:26-1081(-)
MAGVQLTEVKLAPASSAKEIAPLSSHVETRRRRSRSAWEELKTVELAPLLRPSWHKRSAAVSMAEDAASFLSPASDGSSALILASGRGCGAVHMFAHLLSTYLDCHLPPCRLMEACDAEWSHLSRSLGSTPSAAALLPEQRVLVTAWVAEPAYAPVDELPETSLSTSMLCEVGRQLVLDCLLGWRSRFAVGGDAGSKEEEEDCAELPPLLFAPGWLLPLQRHSSVGGGEESRRKGMQLVQHCMKNRSRPETLLPRLKRWLGTVFTSQAFRGEDMQAVARGVLEAVELASGWADERRLARLLRRVQSMVRRDSDASWAEECAAIDVSAVAASAAALASVLFAGEERTIVRVM